MKKANRVSEAILSDELRDKINSKANTEHKHYEHDIVDLDKYSKAEIDVKLKEKLDKTGVIDWEQIVNKPQLADSSWRSPVATFEDLPLEYNAIEDVRLVLDTNEVFSWTGDEWELIGANDVNVDWSHIQGKPNAYTPVSHTHTQSEIIDLTKSWDEITDKPLTYPPTNHVHDQYSEKEHTHNESSIIDLDKYTKAEVDARLLNKSNIEHTHDLRYYTEQEIDTKLSAKSDSTHKHDELYQPIGEYANSMHRHDALYQPIGSYAEATHQHSESEITDLDKYTKLEVDTKLNGKSDTTHNHDGRYPAKSIETVVASHETRLSNIESGYSEGHVHANLSTLNKVGYTGSKSVIDLKDIEGKAETNHTHVQSEITDLDLTVQWDSVDGKPSKFTPDAHTHTKNEIVDFSHTHDDRYFTEEEINTKLGGKSDIGHNHDGAYATKIELTSGLSGKSDIGHIHTITSVTNLQNTLNGKANSSHTHVESEITDLTHYTHPTTKQCNYAYSLPIATATVLGGIKIGANLSISNGVLSTHAPYVHPTAKQCDYSYTHPTTKQCNYEAPAQTPATSVGTTQPTNGAEVWYKEV